MLPDWAVPLDVTRTHPVYLCECAFHYPAIASVTVHYTRKVIAAQHKTAYSRRARIKAGATPREDYEDEPQYREEEHEFRYNLCLVCVLYEQEVRHYRDHDTIERMAAALHAAYARAGWGCGDKQAEIINRMATRGYEPNSVVCDAEKKEEGGSVMDKEQILGTSDSNLNALCATEIMGYKDNGMFSWLKKAEGNINGVRYSGLTIEKRGYKPTANIEQAMEMLAHLKADGFYWAIHSNVNQPHRVTVGKKNEDGYCQGFGEEQSLTRAITIACLLAVADTKEAQP